MSLARGIRSVAASSIFAEYQSLHSSPPITRYYSSRLAAELDLLLLLPNITLVGFRTQSRLSCAFYGAGLCSRTAMSRIYYTILQSPAPFSEAHGWPCESIPSPIGVQTPGLRSVRLHALYSSNSSTSRNIAHQSAIPRLNAHHVLDTGWLSAASLVGRTDGSIVTCADACFSCPTTPSASIAGAPAATSSSKKFDGVYGLLVLERSTSGSCSASSLASSHV